MEKQLNVHIVNRRPILVAGLIASVLTAGIAVWRPAILARSDYRAYDVMTRWVRLAPPTGRVVIVDVDEKSLATIGQWPWRRDVLGRLVMRLSDSGASAVAFDVVFAEPDGHAPTSDGLASVTNPDAGFADAIRARPVVLGYAFTFDETMHHSDSCIAHPLGLAILRTTGADAPSHLFEAAGPICNVPVLTTAATASGFLNAAPDADGVLRRVPLLIGFHDRVYPSVALAAVTLATGTREVVLRVGDTDVSTMFLDGHAVPLDGKSNLLLRYRGRKKTFGHVSAADVLSGAFPPQVIKDKIVFVGATALGAREMVTTPVDTLFSGIEVQATVADNLLARDFVSRPEFAPIVEPLVTLVSGIVIAFAIARAGPLWGSLVALVCLAVPWAAAVWTLSATRIFLSPVMPSLGGIVDLGAIVLVSVLWEERRANRASTDLAATQRLMVQSLLSLTEMRDASTGLHSRRTEQYARLLAERLAAHAQYRRFLTPERIDLLASLAPLHDIGKVAIPDRLLNKPGPLTSDEMEEMRKHPTYGRDVIARAQHHVGVRDDHVLEMAKDIVYTHHERWDGLGYPRGLTGEQIPIPGRVVTLVDIYDALTSRRVYRHQAFEHDAAVALIAAGRGTRFDPAVADAFLAAAPAFDRISHETCAAASAAL